MQNDQQTIIRYSIISVVAMAIVLVLIALITSSDDIAPQQNSAARNLSFVDDSFRQSYLYIENDGRLRDIMKADFIVTLDQILQERYDLTDKIERHALIMGSTNQKGNTVSFRLKFVPSNQEFDTIITKRTDTEGVRVSMKEVK